MRWTICFALVLPFFIGTANAQCGIASHYGFETGTKTASGEHMNPHAMTAAHRTLPMGTTINVRNRSNGRTVRVRINDRGPFLRGRILDLSNAAARVIGLGGTGYVCFS